MSSNTPRTLRKDVPAWYKTFLHTVLTLMVGGIFTLLVSMNANLSSNNTKIDNMRIAIVDQKECFERYSEKMDQRVSYAEGKILEHDFEIKAIKKKVRM